MRRRPRVPKVGVRRTLRKRGDALHLPLVALALSHMVTQRGMFYATSAPAIAGDDAMGLTSLVSVLVMDAVPPPDLLSHAASHAQVGRPPSSVDLSKQMPERVCLLLYPKGLSRLCAVTLSATR